MIEKLKSILLEIRQQRENELKKYEKYCSGNQELYQKRKAILALELPFKTDTASVLNARASAYQARENIRNDLLRIESKQVEVIAEEQVSVHEQRKLKLTDKKCLVIKQKKSTSKNAYAFINEWICSANSESVRQVRRVIAMILQKWITNFYAPHSTYNNILTSSPSTLSAEDLPHILTKRAMETVIKDLDVSASTKEVYLSHIGNLRDFIMRAYPISPSLLGRRSLLSLDDAANLFEFLETRALKSTTSDKYHDILLCRALFYAPLMEKDFFNMGPPDEGASCLRSGDIAFNVPGSFTKLWKGFCCPKSLFIRTFDDKL